MRFRKGMNFFFRKMLVALFSWSVFCIFVLFMYILALGPFILFILVLAAPPFFVLGIPCSMMIDKLNDHLSWSHKIYEFVAHLVFYTGTGLIVTFVYVSFLYDNVNQFVYNFMFYFQLGCIASVTFCLFSQMEQKVHHHRMMLLSKQEEERTS
ncbi:hypothetical protein VN24_20475 [Paenibacillus beijingensis]|uniref:Uncharacterized protein n=1 Tax=Paenibacillus beijingensis TaxID=1126833 RepID=A0A0D5NMJ8_9BACL|nr:hypothetical protein VN24_20475 [Paenibacillus beijingensis]